MKLLQARTRRTTSVSAAIAKWTIVLLLLLLGIAALVFRSTGQSQRIPLGDGSEIRVLQVTYGTDHQYRKLSRLSRWVRQGLSYIHVAKGSPEADVSGLSTSTPSISIWWGWFEKGKDVPDVVPVDRTWMILDSGERIQLGWIFKPEDLRQILVEDPPLHSKTLPLRSVALSETVVAAVEQADADKRPQCKIKVRGLFRDSGQAFNGSISIIPQE
jgi:hypothetical protein